jgi:hypothetical protein
MRSALFIGNLSKAGNPHDLHQTFIYSIKSSSRHGCANLLPPITAKGRSLLYLDLTLTFIICLQPRHRFAVLMARGCVMQVNARLNKQIVSKEDQRILMRAKRSFDRSQ